MYTTLTIQAVATLAVVAGVLLRTVFRRAWAWLDQRILPARYLKKCGVRRRVVGLNLEIQTPDEK